MRFRPHTKALVGTLAVAVSLTLVGCSAGSRTGAQTATQVACDFENPAEKTTVNVLAYNSSAIDPFTNTMVKSCTHDNVTVKHDPIDFPGQVQKTTATLAGDKGTYDIIETYSFIIGTNAAAQKIRPLDELFANERREVQAERPQRVDARGHELRGQAVRLADAGADVRHGLPQGRLRQERAAAAEDLGRDGRRRQEDPGHPAT